MSPADTYTDELLRSSGPGGEPARAEFLARHRDRLRRMVAVRIARRLAARVAPSDVVQEALADAPLMISSYDRVCPPRSDPLLRQVSWILPIRLYSRSLGCGGRSVDREVPAGPPIAEAWGQILAATLLAPESSTPATVRSW